jgi:hypothetical protein
LYRGRLLWTSRPIKKWHSLYFSQRQHQDISFYQLDNNSIVLLVVIVVVIVTIAITTNYNRKEETEETEAGEAATQTSGPY